MDSATLIGGVVAVLLAVTISSVELLSRYAARNIREIFFSRHYVAFALLNTIACIIVFAALPELGEFINIGGKAIDFSARPLLRGVVAGFAYLLIARSSIIDFTYQGNTLGFGFDSIYTSIANYILRHHEGKIRNKLRTEFATLYYDSNFRSIVAYKQAFLLLVQEQRDEVKGNATRQLAECLAGVPDDVVACQGIFLILRNALTSDFKTVSATIARTHEDMEDSKVP